MEIINENIKGNAALFVLSQGVILHDKKLNLEFRINSETQKLEWRDVLNLDICKEWHESTMTINEALTKTWSLSSKY